MKIAMRHILEETTWWLREGLLISVPMHKNECSTSSRGYIWVSNTVISPSVSWSHSSSSPCKIRPWDPWLHIRNRTNEMKEVEKGIIIILSIDMLSSLAEPPKHPWGRLGSEPPAFLAYNSMFLSQCFRQIKGNRQELGSDSEITNG